MVIALAIGVNGMGIKDHSDWVGIILTLNAIERGPCDLPAPPNGSWYLPTTGDLAFSLSRPPWTFSFSISSSPGHLGDSFCQVKHLVIEDTWVLEGFTPADGEHDILRVENSFVSPYEAYYNGFAIALPITASGLPSSLASIVESLRMNGSYTVFAEQMGALTKKRGIRLARVSDHSCVYLALPPVLSAE